MSGLNMLFECEHRCSACALGSCVWHLVHFSEEL